jgi:putative methyltransferase (TIGR04325 family)
MRHLLKRHVPSFDFLRVATSFGSAPDENPWAAPYWQTVSESKLRLAEQTPISDPYTVVALLTNQLLRTGSCRVLDYAGGSGYVFFRLRKAFAAGAPLRWEVVDRPATTQSGTAHAYGLGEQRVRFHEEIPEGPFDIVYINTSLQYLPEPETTLALLAEIGARYLILGRLLAGEFQSQVVVQNVGGHRTPCWFLDLNRIISKVGEYGYEVLLRTDELAPFTYAAEFPPEFRLDREITLALERRYERSAPLTIPRLIEFR